MIIHVCKKANTKAWDVWNEKNQKIGTYKTLSEVRGRFNNSFHKGYHRDASKVPPGLFIKRGVSSYDLIWHSNVTEEVNVKKTPSYNRFKALYQQYQGDLLTSDEQREALKVVLRAAWERTKYHPSEFDRLWEAFVKK
jgi:hypothetical protein